MKIQHNFDLFNLLDLMIDEFRNVRKFEKAGKNQDTMQQRENFKKKLQEMITLVKAQGKKAGD